MTIVLAEFRVSAQEPGGTIESRSGAGVHAVRTVGGQAAYLKVTPATLGPRAIAAARREVRFYQNLAPGAPVRTPPLLAYLDTEQGVAALLEAAGEPQAAPSWTARMWADLGRDLARLHNMPLPTGAEWTRPDALQKALADPDLDQITAFWSPTFPQLAEFLGRRGELENHLNVLPPVFIHGDCHTANLVHSTGSLVFCDWQAAGIGRPVSDLAFLSVRATPAGTRVPRALVDAYVEARPCDRDTLLHALLAEELAIFVFLWPPYAVFNSLPEIARVRRRALDLAARWFDCQ